MPVNSPKPKTIKRVATQESKFHMSPDSFRRVGAPNWAECATTDLDAAEAFYNAVFGWTSERSLDSRGAIYSVQRLDGKRVAGMFELSQELRDMGVPPHWATYFEVADLDKALSNTQAAGGTLLDGPIEEAGVGCIAVIQDNVGAFLRLWTPEKGQAVEAFAVPGAMIWNELCTKEPERAHAFYASVLGLQATVIDAGGKPYTLLKLGEDPVAGILKSTPEIASEGATWDVYFAAKDVDAVVARVRRAGGCIIRDPFDLPVGARMAVVRDPFGAVFEIMQSEE